MFKLYDQVSALNKFSNGHLTDYLDFLDSMNLREFKGGIAYDCPDQPNYWYGHCVDLFKAPNADVTGEMLCKLWDVNVAPYAPKAVKRVVKWGANNLLTYPNIAEKFDFDTEAVLKYCPDNIPVTVTDYTIKPVRAQDKQAMVDLYVSEYGEQQRNHQIWRADIWSGFIAKGNAKYFAIWQDEKMVSIAGLIWRHGVFRYVSVCTHKDYRGKGKASAIVAHIREYALNCGADEIYIVAEHESAASAMYQRAGFRIDRYFYSIEIDKNIAL